VETQVFRDEQEKEGFRFRLRSSASDQLELCRNCKRAKSDVHSSAGILGEPLGPFAYAKSHKNGLDNHIAAIVLGNRQGPVTKLSLAGRKEVISVFETLTSSRQALGKIAVNDKINFDADCGPFTLADLLGINLEQNSPQCKFTHHSVADTLEKVGSDLLIRNTTLMALTGFWIADRDERLASAWPRERTARMRIGERQEAGLKAAGMWIFDDARGKTRVGGGVN
jgi:hypothetical protein